ncbi:ABC transporter ATP-binding protein/permease [uncultured Thermomonospora sp.]|uniref:ABC transporter ATP-binding protein/permease n=1 Tax=uncultured Thermomonospora sp. TaxID=671175 RepID=UPI00259B56C5|nr:ATP-binding cassette domain-containing protein [uncultured Thermomonospora sp.]
MHGDLLRLMRAERAVRRHLAGALGAAVAAGLLVLVQAELLAGLLSGRFPPGAAAALAAVAAARALLVWTQGALAGRTATEVKSALRHRLLRRPPDPGRRSGELVTLAVRGLDALDPYLTGYLPAVAVAAAVPVAVLARLSLADPASAVIVLVTLPLIPLFGALVGLHTRAVTRRQWRTLARLGGSFLDTLRGLPTLRAFGRARHQADLLARLAAEHRDAAMRTLRVAFLSSLVLELCASLSLALVAVPVGLRLVNGSVDLTTGLLVLLLAPEAYLPLRAVGAGFHESMAGIAAADDAFAMLERPAPGALSHRPDRPCPGRTTGRVEREPVGPAEDPHAPRAAAHRPFSSDERAAGREPDGPGNGPHTCRAAACRPSGPREPQGTTGRSRCGRPGRAAPQIRLEGVTVRYPGRAEPALQDVDLLIEPGERVALAGESGGGKSTLLHLVMGFVTPERGRVLIDGVDLNDMDLREWRRHLAFVPQRPHLQAASVADNIRLGRPEATLADVRRAAIAAQAAEFIETLPGRYAARIGERGGGLSAGQRRRIALARALCRTQSTALLVDEPTAHLDGRTEAAVAAAIAEQAAGRTALIVAHRPAMLAVADRIVHLHGGRVITGGVAG